MMRTTLGERCERVLAVAPESERGQATADQARELLDTLGADFVLPTLDEALTHEVFTPEERWAIHWQFRRHFAPGDAMSALFDLATHADGHNLDRLAKGWPELANGIRRWRTDAKFSRRIDLLLDR